MSAWARRIGGLLGLWLPWLSLAQTGEAWQPLHSQGAIPGYFLGTYAEQYQQQTEQMTTLAPGRMAREKAYYQGQVYHIRELLLSGQVLFGDPASEYLERIADQLLRAQPELRAQLRFHVVLSPSVNAFTSGLGYVFVNVGLLARAQSEAQVAFILSHEIAHYAKRHALDLFLQAYRDPKGRFAPQDRSLTQQMVDQNTYSQAAEIEADAWGTRLFISSGYDLKAVKSTFDLLRRSAELPRVDSLDLAWLLPQELVTTWALVPPPDLDQTQRPLAGSTHPIPEERWQKVAPLVQGLPTNGRLAFLQMSQVDFEALRRKCRYTQVQLYLQDRQYEAALLLLHQLSQQYPQARSTLRPWVVYAWYGLARHANAGRFFDVHRTPYEQEAGTYQLLELTERLDAAALTSLALRWLWQLDVGGDKPFLRAMAADLKAEWQALYAEKSEGQGAFLTWAHQSTEGLEEQAPPPSVSVERRRLDQQEREQLLRGLELDLGRLVFVSPDYLTYDEREFVPISYEQSLAKRRQLHQDLMEFAADLGHQPQLLTPDRLDSTDQQALWDLGLLQGWLRHQQRPEGVTLVSPYHAELVKLCHRRETDTFVWMDFYVYTQERKGKPLVLAAGLLLPLLLPYSIYYTNTPKVSTVMYIQIYRPTSYKTLLQLPRIIEMRDRRDVVRSTLYDVLSQLK